ncbi:hypothetical protein [Enterococcus avium]|uniref:hypothetical protein n=1 Tax=Enterococcus avium TaxID=33945 RepID=UPI00288FDE03|nr:hypothetical protein [Enterococcus avium]MDT2390503.1 hypothetical protein [Enterococcus avium]
MERAVLLSDIEFLDGVHESDWERIEEESFLVNVSKPLNENQQVVLDWLKEAYKRTKWSSPFGTVYSTINTHELFVRTRLTKAQQYQVLAAFAEWGISLA